MAGMAGMVGAGPGPPVCPTSGVRAGVMSGALTNGG